MSLAVAPEHAAAGMLRPGDRVAVVASGKPGQPETIAQVLLSPVQVLSVLTSQDEAGSEQRLLVSLAVRPEQAAMLAQAAQGTVGLCGNNVPPFVLVFRSDALEVAWRSQRMLACNCRCGLGC
jgi:Flp pilus assembly protein CpaB